MAGNNLLKDAVILSAVAHEAKKQEKAAEKERERKERDILSPDGKSPEYVVALAIATGNLEGVPPAMVPYVMEERRRIAQEEAEKAAAKAAKAEARKKEKAEGKPRRFTFFGSGKGGGNE